MFRTMALMTSLVALLGGSCAFAATSKAPRQAATPAPTLHVIVIDKMQYGPMPTDVHAGDIIEWVNHDIFEHSATARDGRFDVDLKPGATARIRMGPGTITFFCKFHPGMTGTLAVK